ncbi:spindle pole body component 110-like [Xenia sp. Carnegie-2017]|uniref:spindle pole body component 110-like n=1 Tax=Xenia sp. Carnegie-2017 TaxID=2897299 RepID=UPI001F03F60C|nr:spindle pole body component 110-like [Xenia sp. Carnegie-2017]
MNGSFSEGRYFASPSNFTSSFQIIERSTANGRSTGRESVTSSISRFESCILGRQVVEPQKKHTLYKIEVDGGFQKWYIYRRYRDFVLLNKKLRKLFPNFLLTLPSKRMIGNNFNKDFIRRRQEGLDEFVRNILHHHELCQSDPVLQFFRFENPPLPMESLDACQKYCEDLEQTVVEQKHRIRDLEDEINTLTNDLDKSFHHQKEAQGLATHFESQYSTQGSQLQELNVKLNMAHQHELEARQEVENLKHEMQTERTRVREARDIEKHKQEQLLEEKWSEFRSVTGDVNKQLDNLMTSFSRLSNVSVSYAGESFEFKPAETMAKHTENLKKAIEVTRKQQEDIYKKMMKMYNKEVQDLKAELAREDFIALTRTQDTETLRAEVKEIQFRHTKDMMQKDEMIYELQRQLSISQSNSITVEQKYFYALVLGVKLNMAICGFTMDKFNWMTPQSLYNRAKASGVDIESWPRWVSQEIASFSTPS